LLTACGRLGFDATAGDGGDGGSELACNLAGRVRDTFDDASLFDKLWGSSYQEPGTSMIRSNGRVTFSLAPGATDTYAGLKTSRYYDMHGQRWVIEVDQIAAPGTNCGLQFEYATSTYASLTLANGNLGAAYKTGTFQTVAVLPYVAAEHRFWAISEAAGTIYYETSTDGITFSAFASVPAPFDVSLVRLTAFAGNGNPVAAPGTFVIESAGAPTPVASTACPASTLVDTFDDGVIDHRWASTYNDPCCTIAETGGEMVVGYDGTQGTTALRSAAGLDLRDDAVTIRVTQEPPLASTVLNLTVRRDANNTFELQVSSTQTVARVQVAGIADGVADTRDPAERYLRIRERGGAYFMEVSADRASWRTLRTAAAPFPLDDVLVTVRAGVTANSTAQTLTSFDDFNAP
jgi:hypothetical protein